jgi:HlyD family secretion protein
MTDSYTQMSFHAPSVPCPPAFVRALNASLPVLGATALLAVSLSWVGCSSKGEVAEGPLVTVQVASAERRKIERKVNCQAVLFPLKQAAIVPKGSAPVKKFFVERGSRVRLGQLLAELENQDLTASVVENKGAYEQAKATYETTTRAGLPEEIKKAELDLKAAKETQDSAQKVFDNRQMLYKQGAVPRKDLDDAVVALTQAHNQYVLAQQRLEALQTFGKAEELKAAEGQLSAAKGRYENAQAQLGYSEIRSPIAGVVTDRPLYPGEMAATGTPIITVMDLSQVIAKAHISQLEAQSLRVGEAATLTDPAVDFDFPGKVTVVSPALDPNSTTVEVWVQAANRGERLKPGTSVRLTINAETAPSAVVIPVAALLTAQDGGTSVIVAQDNRPEQKSVKAGIRDGDMIQITEGLKDGEQVVTAGAYELSLEDPEVLKKTKLQIISPKKEEGGG